MVASDTRFHFCTFFLCLQQSNKQDPHNCARLNFSFWHYWKPEEYISERGILHERGITSSHSFNSATPSLYPLCKFCLLFIFYVIVMNIFFFSWSDIITKQKELCKKFKKAKQVNKNSIVLYANFVKIWFYTASTEKSSDISIH